MKSISTSIIPDETHHDHPDLMSEEEYQVAFAKIRQDHFTHKTPQTTPKLVYVTGVPGAGKSSLIQLMKQYDVGLAEYVYINFDELRAYHPRYQYLINHDALNAAARTDVAVERLIGFLIDESVQNKFNVLMDDAAMGQEITEIVLAPFKTNGYHIDATIIAIPTVIAKQSVQLRFEENYAAAKAGLPAMPRWVNTAEQDNAPSAFIETVETLERLNLANTIKVQDRDLNVLYPNLDHSESATTVSKSILLRDLTDIEQAVFQINSCRIQTLMQTRLQTASIIKQTHSRDFASGFFGLKNKSGDYSELNEARHGCGYR
jgi:predicted ABC-type ATPase